MRRLAQRPGRVPGEHTERPEGDRAAHDEMQRHGNPEAWQVRAGEGKVRRRGEEHAAVRLQDAEAFPQVERCVRDVFDHGMRQDEIERATRERQRHAVGLKEMQSRQAPLARETRARLAESIDGIDADDFLGMLC